VSSPEFRLVIEPERPEAQHRARRAATGPIATCDHRITLARVIQRLHRFCGGQGALPRHRISPVSHRPCQSPVSAAARACRAVQARQRWLPVR
jgi:hypothetical protein